MNILRAFDENVKPLKFVRGPLSLLAGLRWLFAHPRFLLLGAIPAAVAGLILSTGLITLIIFSGGIASLVSPLVAGLWTWVATAIVVAVQSAIIATGAVLSYVLFTALALAIGDPIYSKIAEEIEAEAGVTVPQSSWLIGIKDALLLLVKGLAVALVAFIVGLIPVVGGFLSFVVTWIFLPFILGEELLGRTLVPRGVYGQAKTRLLLRDKRAAWSFGATCQLLFSVPIIPVIVMPAAVAGAALLAQELVEESA